MSDPTDKAPVPGPPRRRRRLGCLAAVLLLAGLLAAAYFALVAVADRDLRRAMAEADRNEPGGWRLADIEAARRSYLDGDNAALICLKVETLMPPGWPAAHPGPLAPPPPPKGDADPPPPPPGGMPPGPPPGSPGPQDQPACEERLGNLPRPMLLDPGLLRELRLNLDAARPALDEARKLDRMDGGRFPIQWAPDFVSTNLTSQAARPAVSLLRLEAPVAASEGRGDEACAAVRRMIVVCRALGDEPTLISMLIRCTCQAVTVSTLERVLALGEPSSADLERLQKMLEEEAAAPILLQALRGERAGTHELMTALKAGQVKFGALTAGAGTGGPWLSKLGNVAGPALARRAHPRMLRLMNELVEAARLPVEEQAAPMAACGYRVKAAAIDDPVIRAMLPATTKCAEAYRRTQGTLRCAVTALALERYLRDHGRWPDRLDDLAPRYLPAVLVDPGDGQPLRYRRTPEGVLVYSVGPDGKDDGGSVWPQPGVTQGKDQGFRVWDPARRRQPAREPLAEPAAGHHGPEDGPPGPPPGGPPLFP